MTTLLFILQVIIFYMINVTICALIHKIRKTPVPNTGRGWAYLTFLPFVIIMLLDGTINEFARTN